MNQEIENKDLMRRAVRHLLVTDGLDSQRSGFHTQTDMRMIYTTTNYTN